MAYLKKAEEERLRAAEDVCWTLMIAIQLGLLEDVPVETRLLISEGGLEQWAKWAAKAGLLTDDSQCEQED